MKKKRITVALYLNKVNRSEKVTMGNATHDEVNTSTNFPASAEKTALLAAQQTANDNLQAADETTATGSHASYAAAETAELQFDMAIRNTGYYVQKIADASPENTEEIILSAALKVKKSSVKMRDPNPIIINAFVGGNGTSIKLKIDSDNPRSTHNEILMTQTPDVENSWTAIADITAKKFVASELENGVRYHFKARAINSLGRSDYSGVVSQLAA